MGIRIGLQLMAYESTTMEALDPSYLGIKKEQVEDYIKEHPYPDDPAYSVENLIGDVTRASGFYSLPLDTKQETQDYIALMLNELV